MEHIKLFDSELKLMEIIWRKSPVSAKELTIIANEKFEWNKNTTYTVLKKLVKKEAVKRDDPNFIVTPLISKEYIQKTETTNLIKKLFDGSKTAFFSAFISKEKLSDEEINIIKKIIERKDKNE